MKIIDWPDDNNCELCFSKKPHVRDDNQKKTLTTMETTKIT